MSRTYVVTGSESGIGAATCDYLRSRGNRVVGVDRAGSDVVVDLSDPHDRAGLADLIGGYSVAGIDGVIANAGSALPVPDTVRVNYFGTVATLEALRPELAKSSAPRAVVTASMACIHPHDQAIVDACLAGDEEAAVAAAGRADPGQIYASTKVALVRWLRRNAIREQWAGAGIPLNAIAPGVIVTPMTTDYVETPEGRAMLAVAVPMPLGGYGQPEQVAALLAWLASEENSMTTGQVIFIDGGADAVLRGDTTW